MSICRWSDDDYGCDLYCYEGQDGYVTHVATSRYVGGIPRVPPIPVEGVTPQWWSDWTAARSSQSKWLETADFVAIGGPYDGQTFRDAEPEELRDRLRELRQAGYRFPDYVFEDLPPFPASIEMEG